MNNDKKKIFEYLAVEIAGQFQDHDLVYPPYEYLPETTKLCKWLEMQPKELTSIEVAHKFAAILEESWETPFDPADLTVISDFALLRLREFNKFFSQQ